MSLETVLTIATIVLAVAVLVAVLDYRARYLARGSSGLSALTDATPATSEVDDPRPSLRENCATQEQTQEGGRRREPSNPGSAGGRGENQSRTVARGRRSRRRQGTEGRSVRV
jgi:hypothetical protein